jgi:hypothetical protein
LIPHITQALTEMVVRFSERSAIERACETHKELAW